MEPCHWGWRHRRCRWRSSSGLQACYAPDPGPSGPPPSPDQPAASPPAPPRAAAALPPSPPCLQLHSGPWAVESKRTCRNVLSLWISSNQTPPPTRASWGWSLSWMLLRWSTTLPQTVRAPGPGLRKALWDPHLFFWDSAGAHAHLALFNLLIPGGASVLPGWNLGLSLFSVSEQKRHNSEPTTFPRSASRHGANALVNHVSLKSSSSSKNI